MLLNSRPPDRQLSRRALSILLAAVIVVGLCAMILGCAKDVAITNYSPRFDRVRPDGVIWRWEDYSNRIWISVSGVGLQTRLTNPLKKISFSYSPNTGKSSEEAIAITAFDMFAGIRAERFLLRVFYGTGRLTPLNPSEMV